MANYKPRRQAAYDYLINHHMTPLESRVLSVLPRLTPAVRLMTADRDSRWDRFQKIAASKIARGRWQPQDLIRKWASNLYRSYRKSNVLVQHGPVGKQQRMPKGMPNPWALYRRYVDIAPDKGYESPWEKQKSGTHPPLDRTQWFVRRAGSSPTSNAQLRIWIEQLNQSIKKSGGKRRAAFIINRDRLQDLLKKQS